MYRFKTSTVATLFAGLVVLSVWYCKVKHISYASSMTEETKTIVNKVSKPDRETSVYEQSDKHHSAATNAESKVKVLPTNAKPGETVNTKAITSSQRPVTGLARIRRTSLGEVPEKVKYNCSDLRTPDLLNVSTYRNKEHCCQEAEKHHLSELCGNINATTIGNKSTVQGCSCIDFMACKMVVLTATSDNHWLESLDAIASVQSVMPDVQIKVMDLGMSMPQAEQLLSLRNVQVLKFPFEVFPPHVRNLQTYAWKPLSIQMMLAKYEVVFYMDASIRLKRPMVSFLFPSLQIFPIRVLMNGFYDGAYTVDGTYKYLGVSRKEGSKHIQLAGNRLLLRNCSYLQHTFISPFVDCALHADCIAPPGSSPFGCNNALYGQQVKNIDKLEEVKNIGCHRFDQSVLTVLFAREHIPDDSPVMQPKAYDQTTVIWREPTYCFTLFLDS